MNTLIATKTYRPDTVSIADWNMDPGQDRLRIWWKNAGPRAEIAGGTLAEKLPAHRTLRAGEFTVIAKKRRGWILLEAHTQ